MSALPPAGPRASGPSRMLASPWAGRHPAGFGGDDARWRGPSRRADESRAAIWNGPSPICRRQVPEPRIGPRLAAGLVVR